MLSSDLFCKPQGTGQGRSGQRIAAGQWQPLISQLRNLMPQLLVLGTCDPPQRQGPAIWIRCVIEGVLPEVLLPERAAPVIYMPNVSRQTLRNVEECPWGLQPLVE